MDTFTNVQRYLEHTFSIPSQDGPRSHKSSHHRKASRSLEDIEMAISGSFPVERQNDPASTKVHVPEILITPPGSFFDEPYMDVETQESHRPKGGYESLKVVGTIFFWVTIFFSVVVLPHLPPTTFNLSIYHGFHGHQENASTLQNLPGLDEMTSETAAFDLPVLFNVTAISTSTTFSNETAISTIQQEDDTDFEQAEPHEQLTDAQATVYHARLSAIHFQQFLRGDVYPVVKSVSFHVVNTLSDYIPAIPAIPIQARDNKTESSRANVRTFECKSRMCSVVIVGEYYEQNSNQKA